jgi:predicted ATPase with chaperone activity
MVETALRRKPLPAFLEREAFRPVEPRKLDDTGLTEPIVEGLICKYLLSCGSASGRAVAEHLCLPLGLLETMMQRLRGRQILTHRGAAALHDYVYVLTEQGREYTQLLVEACAYCGPAPVPLVDYVTSVDAQTITAEGPKRADLEQAFHDISVDPGMFAQLGPAINSGTGLFLYGAPGNGKTTLAERVTRCFGQEIWIPQTLMVEGEIIQFFDPAYHDIVEQSPTSILAQTFHDRRWVRIRRPTVVVGGELTLDCLEIRHNAHTRVSEAPLQLKSNCGTLLIDDFGRQRVNHIELLNRWIIPLEKHYDFLVLPSGKKIQVPFDQLIIFSTNLEPKDLVDEAFLRRIPYKINVPDPDEQEFHYLFKLYAEHLGFAYEADTVEDMLARHYRPRGRPLRRCHPRDLLLQVHHYCASNELSLEMKPEYFDQVIDNYFTVVAR